MSNYIVNIGETITDVLLNSTGTIGNVSNINNWQLILDANNFDTWTPALTAGQIIIIPDSVQIQTNVLNELQNNKACNNLSITQENFQSQIDALILEFMPPEILIDENGAILLDENGLQIVNEQLT
jgi:hypothetical protein